MQPLISIIIPLYNSERYIADCIKSAVGQTWPNKEIIIINDGSTDQSLKIAKTFESLQVKVFSQENKGASAARNYGLREAKGEYIQFLDADDILSSNKIESQIESLKESFDNISVCATVHFFDGDDYFKDQPLHEWYRDGSDDPADFLIKLYGGDLIGPSYGGMIQPNAWLTPRKIIDKAGDWNETLSLDDDGEFFCRIILVSTGIRYSTQGINYYRKFKSAKNLSAQKNKKAIESILASAELKEKYLLNSANSELAKKALARQYLEIAVATYPQFRHLSKKAENNSIKLGGCNKKYYTHTTLYRFTTFLLGWKFSAMISYLKNKYKFC